MSWSEYSGSSPSRVSAWQTWVSLATIMEFIVVVAVVVLLRRMVRHLCARGAGAPKLDVGQQYASRGS